MLPPNPKGPMRQGTPDTSVSGTNTTNVISSTGPATNPQTFLYDVGLQNIYQDYQKSVATLNQQQQQSLQDAYYIREMSKKYLGEYASNVGIGDVSGNLLDIYGQYQQNVAGIRSEFGAQEMSLQQQYETTRRELETGKMLAEQTAPGQAPIGFMDISSPTVVDTSNNIVDNPNYIPDLDYNYFGVKDFNSAKQSFYVDDFGVEYKNVTLSSDEEADQDKFPNSPTFADLTAFYQEQPKTKGKTPAEGDIIPYTNGARYVLRGGAWYRLEQTTTGVFSTIKSWRDKESFWNEVVTGSNKDVVTKDKILVSSGNANIVYFNTGELKFTNADEYGKVRTHDFDVNSTNEQNQKIIQEFARVHGAKAGTPSSGQQFVIEYNGKLYYMNQQGQVWQMRKRS